jgi:hypothetical protein
MSLLKKGHCKTTIYTIKVERWLSVLLLLEKLTYKETKTQCLYASRSCQPEMTYGMMSIICAAIRMCEV